MRSMEAYPRAAPLSAISLPASVMASGIRPRTLFDPYGFLFMNLSNLVY